MKIIRLFISLLVVLLITSGCSSDMYGQKIAVQKRIVTEDDAFKSFNEVTEKTQVQQAIGIVKNANWENEKVDMIGHTDYQFQFLSKNSIEEELESYSLWDSENGEIIEISNNRGKYAKLTKQESADLFKILTGK